MRQYLYGVWYYVYRQSGLKLSFPIWQSVHSMLRPVPPDPTLEDYRTRSLVAIGKNLALPHVAAVLCDLDADEWLARWLHRDTSPQRSRIPFGYDETQKPLYPIPAYCQKCGHEFLGREAITAPSLQNCICFWCSSGQLRLLQRYPSTQQTIMDLP